jgi:hypothetical protein
MRNNSPDFYLQDNPAPDILDFLAEVNRTKRSETISNFDIVDIVKAFYGLKDEQKAFKMSESDGRNSQDEALNLVTSSTMTRMSNVPEESRNQQESDLEKYQYLFDERAAILEYEALPVHMTKTLAEDEAKQEIAILYAKEKQISVNSQQVTEFINQIIT